MDFKEKIARKYNRMKPFLYCKLIAQVKTKYGGESGRKA